MTLKILFASFLMAFGFNFSSAQSDWYHTDSVREVRIYFAEGNWDHILDSFYIAGQNERLTGDVVLDGDSFKQVGVRYKGFSSVSVNRVKNPFNIKLDHVITGQEYRGINKIKLSNVIQDPSFIREVLSYEIARKYMPASRSNFANVYVNDTLVGLYTNVEAVNKDFLEQHFTSRDNSFFKCNPDALDLSGENSNLSNTPGTDPNNYKPYYDLRSDFGWDDLYALIDTLNDHPEEIDKVLNVDRTLWMHAFNYALVNFDSYVGYAQNYYLYQDDNHRFNPILWDLNMSFASYRFSDASTYWDGFDINEAQIVDPLSHYNGVSVIARPLLRNLFANATYRKMFMAHMRTIIEENFSNQNYFVRGQNLQNVIDTEVANDSNKFYTYADFQDNLTSTVSDLIDYPGITDLMDARTIYLNNYPGWNAAPDISNLTHDPLQAVVGEEITFTCEVTNANQVTFAYRFSPAGLFTKVPMFDDGSHNDGNAGDGQYGAVLAGIGTLVEYYIYAENDSAGRFSPERAEYEFHSLSAIPAPKNLVINEFMAINANAVADQDDEYDDWIEIFNTTAYEINLNGLFLSNQLNQPTLWALPNQTIKGHSYLTVWADAQTSQSGIHANSQLAQDGGFLALSWSDSSIVDSLTYGQQYPVLSTGRFPNGSGNFQEMLPTFEAENLLENEAILTDDFFIYPNPANTQVNLIIRHPKPFNLELINVQGQILAPKITVSNPGLITFSTTGLASGLYYVRLTYDDYTATQKVVINQ